MTEKIQSTSGNSIEQPSAVNSGIAEKLIDIKAKSWWLRLDELSHDFNESFSAKNVPIEQLVIGHDNKNIRFFNFSDHPMSYDRVADCERFVDTITQLFGDDAYKYVTDVVIAPMKKTNENAESGRVYRNFEGVLFVDSGLLELQGTDFVENENHINASKFLYVMTHEFGHALHGHGYENTKELLDFAKRMGWDVDALQSQSPLWAAGIGDAAKFAPSNGVIVRHQDGAKEVMTEDAYIDQHGEPYDQDGKLLSNVHFSGLPTDYSEVNPKESYAETTAELLLGSFVINHMPEVRDAWLDHAKSRGPLASPIDRTSITVTRNTGDSIVYPTIESVNTVGSI